MNYNFKIRFFINFYNIVTFYCFNYPENQIQSNLHSSNSK